MNVIVATLYEVIKANVPQGVTVHNLLQRLLIIMQGIILL